MFQIRRLPSRRRWAVFHVSTGLQFTRSFPRAKDPALLEALQTLATLAGGH